MEVLQKSKLDIFHENWNKSTLHFDEEVLHHASKLLSSTDFPTTKTEAWKYTRVSKIATNSFTQQKGKIDALSLPFQNMPALVFVNGVFDKQLSSSELPKGIEFSLLAQTKEHVCLGSLSKESDHLFATLNTQYAQDGAFINIKKETKISSPIQLIHVLTGENTISNVRNLIVCEAFSEASIIQVYLTENAHNSFSNCVTEILVHENAKLHVEKLQNEEESNFHISSEHVRQEKDSNFQINTFTLNGSFVRNDLFIQVNAQNCETHLNGTYVLNGKQHVDNHTTVDHKFAHCESNELYKGVIDENATAVFNGKVFVRKDAQKINAYQSNGNVLLSDSASVNSKPELEIYADDVKCSHGSTTGQLDEEAMYYLRTRGISEKSAKSLLVTAFIGDVLNKIEHEEVLAYVQNSLKKRFDWDF